MTAHPTNKATRASATLAVLILAPPSLVDSSLVLPVCGQRHPPSTADPVGMISTQAAPQITVSRSHPFDRDNLDRLRHAPQRHRTWGETGKRAPEFWIVVRLARICPPAARLPIRAASCTPCPEKSRARGEASASCSPIRT